MQNNQKQNNRTLKSNSSYLPTCTNLLLPNNIASRMLDIELQIQANHATRQLVMELLDLYSQAIEFYEQHQDLKYKLYQQRIQNLVKKPDINHILNGGAVTLVTNKQREVLEMKKDAERTVKQQAKTIIKFYDVEIEKQTTKIQKEIDSQKQKILQRVKSRSMSKNKNTDLKESDISDKKMQPKVETDKDLKVKLVLDALEQLRPYAKVTTKKSII